MSSHPYSVHVLPSARSSERMPAPRAGGALRIAAACMLALALAWGVAEHMPAGQGRAALALALCAVLVSAPRARPLVAALGLLFSAAVGFALLVQAWHMPSDVIGGYLFAGLCMALAVAGLRAAERRWPQHAGSQRAP